jgi:hypothetical protein
VKRALLTASLLLAAGLCVGGDVPTCRVYDSHGHLLRSMTVRRRFWVMTGHPHGWPGHVVDHKQPLCACGPDSVANLQWQTTADGKAKDLWERALCAGRTSLAYDVWQKARGGR